MQINSLIGNQSFIHRYQRHPNHFDSYSDRIRIHLSYVLDLLKKNASPNQHSAKRQKNIESLQKYIQRAIFPKNIRYQNPTPCFLDHSNNLCAVGYLLWEDNQLQLIQKINASFQYNRIKQMDLPQLVKWVQQSGLSLRQVQMIQPEYQFVYVQYCQKYWNQYEQQFLKGKSKEELEQGMKSAGGVVQHHKNWLQRKGKLHIDFMADPNQRMLLQHREYMKQKGYI